MRKLMADFFKNWNEFFSVKKKGNIDWKSIGQLRSKLNTIRMEPTEVVTPGNTSRAMARNFNSLGKRVNDREGLSRWYGQSDVEHAEKQLHAKIEAGQRSVQALKQSGQFPAIRPEEAEALREVHQRYMSPAPFSEDKIAAFLSGASDNIDDFIFQDISVESVQQHQASMRYLNSQPDDTVQDIPVITEEMIAALEKSANLESISSSLSEECAIAGAGEFADDSLSAVESISALDALHLKADSAETGSRVEPSRKSKKSKKKSRGKRTELSAEQTIATSSLAAAIAEVEEIAEAESPIAFEFASMVENCEVEEQEFKPMDPLASMAASNVMVFRPRVKILK